MNELQIFNFENHGVRSLVIDGEPWLVGKDVAEALGYSNSRDAISRHVDDEDKNTVAIHDGIGNPNKTIINESGVYALIFGSKLENAKRFKRWVTSEVLPQIRRTGSYNAKPVEDPNERLAEIISKCTMPEQLDLIRDLYNIPANIQKKEQNEPMAPTIKVLTNKDCPTLQSRYRTIDGFLKNYTIHEGDLTKDVYHDYCEYCHTLNVTPRTRQAFVARMKETTKLYIEYSSTVQQSVINRRK